MNSLFKVMPLDDSKFDMSANEPSFSKLKPRPPPKRKITETLGQNPNFDFSKFQKQNLRIGGQGLDETEMVEFKNEEGKSDEKPDIFLSEDNLSGNEDNINIE